VAPNAASRSQTSTNTRTGHQASRREPKRFLLGDFGKARTVRHRRANVKTGPRGW
jgi:hypothetical protein